MKNKKFWVLMAITCLSVAILLISCFILIKIEDTKKTNLQNVDMGTGKLEEVTLVNDIELINGKVSFDGEHYRITMRVVNNTRKDIDMSIYRISFRDIKNEEIEWYSGDIFGIVKDKDYVDIVVESYSDLSKVKNVYYEEFFVGD